MGTRGLFLFVCFLNLTQPLPLPQPTVRKLKIFFLHGDRHILMAAYTTTPQLGASEDPLREGNTFLATGGRATGEAKHHNHLPLAG